MVRHHDKAMELKLALIAISEQRLDKEFGIRSSLEMALPLMSKDGDRICTLRLPNCGHTIMSIPQGLKPLRLL